MQERNGGKQKTVNRNIAGERYKGICLAKMLEKVRRRKEEERKRQIERK